MTRGRSSIVPLLVKLAALAALLAAAPGAWWAPVLEETDDMLWFHQWLRLAAYLTTVALALVGLGVLPFLRDPRLRVPAAVVLLTGFAVDLVALAVSGHHLSLGLASVAVRESALAPGFARLFAIPILSSVLIAGAIGVAIAWPPGRRWSLPTRSLLVPAAALAGTTALIAASDGQVDAFPSPYAVPAQVLLALRGESTEVERRPVVFDGALRPAIDKIVMVVDESVRGDYLGINAPHFDNTPALDRAADQLANFGVATAGTNCSAEARLMLRLGLRPSELPDPDRRTLGAPTLWQYAARAGYRTVMIDTWYRFGRFHSYMDLEEAWQIDEYITVLGYPYHDRDRRAAEALLEALQADGPLLVYVNKYGTHMPYDDGFPPDLAYDPTPLVRDLPLSDVHRQSLRDYHKALRWSVDGFFARVLPAIGDDTLLLYTSDHGEGLYEGGVEIGHCSFTNPPRGELLVPLFAATGTPALRDRLRAAATRARGRASHFEIFPTLLELMGYPAEWVESRYGPSLWRVPVERHRAFLLGSPFQADSRWITLDDAEPPQRAALH